jgi:hypothetical protein
MGRDRDVGDRTTSARRLATSLLAGRAHVNAAPRSRRWASAALAGAFACGALAANGTPAAAADGGLSDLLAVAVEYRAHKLIFTITTKARLALVPAGSVKGLLHAPPTGDPVALPQGTVAKLTVENDLPFGGRDVTEILLDPQTGAAIQTDKVTTMHGGARTVTRYLKDGVYSWRWQPADRREERSGPTGWTRAQEHFTPFPASLPAGAVVTDGYALLPLAEMARLDRPGAELHLYAPSSDDFVALDFDPDGFEMCRLDIEEESPANVRRWTGPRLVRSVRVSARPLPGTGRNDPRDLGVLGFKGGVTLLVDARTGVPLVLTGRAAYIGTVTARLVRVRYAYDPAAVRRR